MQTSGSYSDQDETSVDTLVPDVLAVMAD
jgi:hypothetical protein